MASEEQIRELAYAIWEQEGRLEGQDLDYYLRAKQMLEERDAASSSAKEPVPSSATLRPPAAPKTGKRPSRKRRSKKV
jgi:hypothetical protein